MNSVWHSTPEPDALTKLEVDATRGLSPSEIAARTTLVGSNEIPKEESRSVWKVIFAQFQSPLIYLLIAASAGAAFMGEVNDALVILAVLLLNATIGVFQENKAERSLAALRKLSHVPARVLREGKEDLIDAHALVPGDIVLLNAGDAVPADGRILEVFSLVIEEAPLTGESLPIAKSIAALPPDTSLADRQNMAYSGTFVTAGRAKIVVTETGIRTEIGKIAQLTGGVKESATPLEKRVREFSRYLLVAAAILFVVILLIGRWHNIPWTELLMIAISQVVSMVPEGLPMAITVALAVGVQRMAAQKTIVRRISAVETLGSTTVICSDKTGTLTRNEMTVTELRLVNGRNLSLEGVGYAADGRYLEQGAAVTPKSDDELGLLIRMAALCNDADVVVDSAQGAAAQKVIGDPTEASLIVMARKAGISVEALKKDFPRTAEIPFDSATKWMVTEHSTPGGEKFLAIKGGPGAILDLCTLDEPKRQEFRALSEEMGARALRVLAIGHVPCATITGQGPEALAGKVQFLGLIGQLDPPRTEVAAAMQECRTAGIRAIMITGDQKVTGLAVAQAIGLASSGDLALDGKELDALDPAALTEKLDHVRVFARVHPSQKLRIVEALQKHGHVVAMTGDGVNDAPALTQADVGVAMGITGTEVAKEASKIVITDDNFSTIVSAVAEGRLVYQNIKKIILLLFSTGAAEVLILVLALLFGYPPPFAAVQILWNNLVSEGVIAGNFVMEPRDGSELKRPPISPDEPLVTRLMLMRMAVLVPTMVLVTLGWFVWRLNHGIPLAVARSETFVVIFFCEWFNVLNCRSETKSGLDLAVFRNPWLVGGLVVGALLQAAVIFWRPLGDIFRTVPIDLSVVPLIVLAGSLMLWVEEARKFFARRKGARAA